MKGRGGGVGGGGRRRGNDGGGTIMKKKEILTGRTANDREKSVSCKAKGSYV